MRQPLLATLRTGEYTGPTKADCPAVVKQSPTGGETGGGKASADGRRNAQGFTLVYQRQRLLIDSQGRSSESRTGENPTYGLTRGPEVTEHGEE